ncbi:MAG TPA: hypothetical protein PLK46_09780 [Propioniciclava sp.]|jgi:hypothetical protein|uniref:hypothetical protein n=1 Tax=Propioniciclava sp. TaxID=2038686 RepID=UPI002CFA51E1|nr:hypothetical protein [Propioniciclava sp.]HRL80601.1 hypothetical protein [Propioniciclava sp.]
MPVPDASTSQPSAQASSEPGPSATGTWTPPASDAPVGPVAPAPVVTRSADADQPVTFDSAATVTLDSVSAITVGATTPGEVTGPAVKVVVTVANGSQQAVDVSSAVVSLTAADGTLGIPTTAGDPVPLAGAIAPGASTTGSYVFMLDPAAGRTVSVTVNYAAAEPVAVFTGKAT